MNTAPIVSYTQFDKTICKIHDFMHTHCLSHDTDWSPRPLPPTGPLDYGVNGVESALSGLDIA